MSAHVISSSVTLLRGFEPRVFRVVAVAGTVGDWAAYALELRGDGRAPSPREVAARGCKLHKNEALTVFPYLSPGAYRR